MDVARRARDQSDREVAAINNGARPGEIELLRGSGSANEGVEPSGRDERTGRAGETQRAGRGASRESARLRLHRPMPCVFKVSAISARGHPRLAHLQDFAHDLGFSLYLDQAIIKDHTEIISNFPVEQITVVDLMPGYSTYGKS